MTTKQRTLINGYIRDIQTLLNCIIPNDINYLIVLFYGHKYKCFGIGRNHYGEFALKHHHKITKKWVELLDFGLRIHSLYDLYCGLGRFLIKNEYHRIYCCGKNDRSECGLSINKDRVMKFKQLKQLETTSYDHQNDYISLISNGKMSKHSFLKTNNGEYYGIGCNHYAQFGNGDKTYDKITTPIQLYELEDIFDGIDIIQIECGMLHSMFLTANGDVYSCGFNGLGQLGFQKSHKNDFENEYQFTPTKVPFLYDIIAIAIGNDHNLCLNKDNLYVFGNNDNGNLGLGLPPIPVPNDDNEEEPDIIDDESRKFAFEYESDGDDDCFISTKEQQPKFIDIPTVHEFFRDKKIKDIKCGGSNSGVILQNGDFYTFGYNFWHQSIGKEIQMKYPQLLQSFDDYSDLKIVDADLGMSHSLLLTNTNKLYSVGNNAYSQCSNQVKKEQIVWPYLLTKNEIGIHQKDIIERVIAGELSTFVFTSTPLK